MLHDGTLEPHDIPNGRIADELLGIIRGPDGLYWTGKFFTGTDRLNPKIHMPSLRWFQHSVCQRDAVVAFRDPRSSGKTSSTTKNFPFWLWAQTPQPGTPQQGINTRVGIVAPKKDIASYNFIADINRRFLSKTPGMQAYRALTGDWVKPNRKHWSNRHGLLLQRDEEGGEPSLMPIGMESIATSAHFHILFIDDPIHEQNYKSEILVGQCVNWMYLSFNLVLPERGSRAFVGNFWRLGDVQDQLRPSNPHFKGVKVWERGMIGCDECVDNRFPLDLPAVEDKPASLHECVNNPFPVCLLDVEADPDGKRVLIEPGMEIVDLARESTPSYQFATQNLNRPASASTLHLKREWLRYYDIHYAPNGDLALAFPVAPHIALPAMQEGSSNYINLGHQLGAQEIVPIWKFGVYILIDPAASEEAGAGRARFAFAVVARQVDAPRTVLLEEYAKNAPVHEHIHAILDAYEKWRPYFKKIGYESVAFQATLGDSIKTAAREIRKIHTLRDDSIMAIPRLRGEGPQVDRIKYVMMPLMESGRFYIQRTHRLLVGEVDTFGVAGAPRDLLDAISNGPRVWGEAKNSYDKHSAVAAVEAARRRRATVDETGY